MSEPITIYNAKDGKPLTVYGRAQMDALLASGDYVLESPPPPTPKAAPKDDAPAKKPSGKKE